MTFDPRVNVSNGRRPMLSCVFIPNGDGLDPPEAEARLREPLALGNRTTMRKRRSTASWWRWWRRRPCPNRRIAASGKTDEDWRSGSSGWSLDYWPRWPMLGSQKGPHPLFLFPSVKLSLKIVFTGFHSKVSQNFRFIDKWLQRDLPSWTAALE